MHIGFLSFESPFGSKGCGVASYLRAMIPTLIEAGHRVTLIAAGDDGPAANPYGDALRIVRVKLPNAHWYVSKLPIAGKLLTLPLREMEWSFEFRRSVSRAMKEEPIDVLEVTELGTWWLARSTEVPLVSRLHGAEYTFSRFSGERVSAGSAWSRRLQRKALNNARVVTAPSHFHAAEVSREMNWGSEHVSVVPNVIAPEMLERAREHAEASETSLTESSPMILYTGRLAPVKGTSLLLDAAVEVLKEFPHAEFVLAGPWQMPFPASDWPRRLDGANRIRWVGHRNQEQLAELYRRAAVFVMPSFYETFGISCIEAMAFQVPVVAAQAGALPEVIGNERVGLTVAPGNKTAFAHAITRLLRDPDLRRRMGIAGRNRVLAHYTPDAVCKDMLAVYQQASVRQASARLQ